MALARVISIVTSRGRLFHSVCQVTQAQQAAEELKRLVEELRIEKAELERRQEASHQTMLGEVQELRRTVEAREIALSEAHRAEQSTRNDLARLQIELHKKGSSYGRREILPGLGKIRDCDNKHSRP